jgi:hypothetical protein
MDANGSQPMPIVCLLCHGPQAAWDGGSGAVGAIHRPPTNANECQSFGNTVVSMLTNVKRCISMYIATAFFRGGGVAVARAAATDGNASQ